MGSLLLAAQVRDLLAGDYRQHLPALDRLAQFGLDCLDHTRHPRYHVGGAVLVKTDFTGEVYGCTQRARPGSNQLHPGSFDLGDGQVHLPLFIVVLCFCMAFGGVRLAMLMAVFSWLGSGCLAERTGPGQATEA